MEVLEILRPVIGFLFALFIPGFLVTMTFFDDLEILERIALGIALSITVTISIGIILGYNEAAKNLTGGITEYNVWRYTLIFCAIMFVLLIFKFIYKKWIKKEKKDKKK